MSDKIKSSFFDAFNSLMNDSNKKKIVNDELLELMMFKTKMCKDFEDHKEIKNSLKEKYPDLSPNWHASIIDLILFAIYNRCSIHQDNVAHRFKSIQSADYDALMMMYHISGDSIKIFLKPILSYFHDEFYNVNSSTKVVKKSSIKI